MCYLLFSILTAVDKTAKWVIQRDAIMRNVWFKGAPLLFVYIINAF